MFEPIIKDKKYVTYDEKPVYSSEYNIVSNKLNSKPSLV